MVKQSPDLMMVIHLSSPDDSRDLLYISNYATLHVKDVLARIDGVGNVTIFGARDYSMRIWLDPEKLAARNLTAGDVVTALRGQNVQVAAGVINQPPVPQPGAFQLNVETQGRLTDPAAFGNIIVKSESDGRVVRIRDIGRVELGAADYNRSGYLDERVAIPMGIFQRPGLERACKRRRPCRRRWRSCRSRSPRASDTTSSTTRPYSSRNRSRR